MRGIVVVFLVGAAVSAVSFFGSTYFVEAFTPLFAMLTALGMLTAWLIGTDHTPRKGRGAGPSQTHTRAA
jgi:hypothetical protein